VTHGIRFFENLGLKSSGMWKVRPRLTNTLGHQLRIVGSDLS
jgi:hypothetical protein